VREDVEKLLRDATIRTLALGIAIGWSLYSVAHGFGIFIDGLTTHLPSQDGPFSQTVAGGGLTWAVGHHIVTLDPLAIGLVELALVVAAAAYLSRHVPRDASTRRNDHIDA
jgi:hypothetical protein